MLIQNPFNYLIIFSVFGLYFENLFLGGILDVLSGSLYQ